jgi:hypothetical protein
VGGAEIRSREAFGLPRFFSQGLMKRHVCGLAGEEDDGTLWFYYSPIETTTLHHHWESTLLLPSRMITSFALELGIT